MVLVDYKKILQEKYLRQKSIKELQISANGYAVFIGQVSPGCKGCFTEKGCKRSVFVGRKCPFQCPMCYYERTETDADIQNEVNSNNQYYIEKLEDETYSPSNICYNAEGEPFLYLDQYRSTYEIIKKIEEKKGIKIHKRIYTTGIYFDQENIEKLQYLDVEEVRFHVSASDFSKSVFASIELAAKSGFRIAIEEPAWMLNRQKLMNHLSTFNDVGVQHLNMDEIDISPSNIEKINDAYPYGKMYKNLNYHLYDDGMVYDIMEEVLARGYAYSVLDCNSDLLRARTVINRSDIGFDKDDFKGIL